LTKLRSGRAIRILRSRDRRGHAGRSVQATAVLMRYAWLAVVPTVATVGCGDEPGTVADAGSVDARAGADGGASDSGARFDAFVPDDAADGSSSRDAVVDVGVADAGSGFDAAGCAVGDAACGGPIPPFMPSELCGDTVRSCLATCTTASCYLTCSRAGAFDCFLCFLSQNAECQLDWCPSEFVTFTCCDANVCHFGRCCECASERADLSACLDRVWATHCRDTYYEPCFAPAI